MNVYIVIGNIWYIVKNLIKFIVKKVSFTVDIIQCNSLNSFAI